MSHCSRIRRSRFFVFYVSAHDGETPRTHSRHRGPPNRPSSVRNVGISLECGQWRGSDYRCRVVEDNGVFCFDVWHCSLGARTSKIDSDTATLSIHAPRKHSMAWESSIFFIEAATLKQSSRPF